MRKRYCSGKDGLSAKGKEGEGENKANCSISDGKGRVLANEFPDAKTRDSLEERKGGGWSFWITISGEKKRTIAKRQKKRRSKRNKNNHTWLKIKGAGKRGNRVLRITVILPLGLGWGEGFVNFYFRKGEGVGEWQMPIVGLTGTKGSPGRGEESRIF